MPESPPPFCGSPHDHCRGCERVAPSLQTAHQALRFIGPSFCGLVDIIMQFGDLQSQGAGHPRWWRRFFRLRFHLQKQCSPCLRVHSGDHCCDEAPVCCPLLGSDHFLCVAQPIPLPLGPSTRSERRPLPPLRDWAPTLLRARGALLHWSSRLDALLCGPLPVSDRSLIVEEIFNNLITILLQHAPSQRQLPRRSQFGGRWSVSQHVWHAMVRGGISGVPRILETAIASALHGPISIGLSGIARILSGLNGKIVLPIFPG